MHDPKFEKEVQQKMEGLEFSPSESVWTNVQQAVGNQRHTRRIPFFWRLLVPALFILGAGTFVYVRQTSSKTSSPAVVASASSAATSPAAATAPASTPATPSSSAVAAPAVSEQRTPVQPAVSAPVSVTAAGDFSAAHSRKHTSNSSAAGNTPVGNTSAGNTSAGNTSTARNGARRPLRAEGNRGGDEQSNNDGRAGGERTATGEDILGLPPAVTGTAIGHTATPIAEGSAHTTESPTHTAFAYNPGLADIHRLSPLVKATVVSSKKTPIIVSKPAKINHPWEAGFTGSIGISSIQGPLIKPSSAPATFSNATANLYTVNGRASGKQYVSDVRPDLSYSAGIVARKPLSSRWALTLGLDLHYYSSQLRLGYQNHYIPVPSSASLITTAAAPLPVNASYYPAGDQQQFINKYYFLELPVTIQWKINRSHLLPIYWEGGVSLAYLMGADAVYYNTHSGVYFKDDGTINKTQVNLSTSLMVGLPIRGIHIQVGPQLQYGLTNLMNTKIISNDQRFMYTGIRVVLMPGKK